MVKASMLLRLEYVVAPVPRVGRNEIVQHRQPQLVDREGNNGFGGMLSMSDQAMWARRR